MEPRYNLEEPTLFRPSDILDRRGEPSWSQRLFEDGRNAVELMCSRPGERSGTSIHQDHNEFWIVLRGELIWDIGYYPPLDAVKGDIVFCPAGLAHTITTVGDGPALRLAVFEPDGITEKGGTAQTGYPSPTRQTLPTCSVPELTSSWRDQTIESLQSSRMTGTQRI